jgi:hypothetical protein
VTKTVLGAVSRKTEMVFRSSSVREPEPGEEGDGGSGGRGSALDAGGGGADVDRHARTAESARRADRMRLVGRTSRRGIALSFRISRVYRARVRFYSSTRRENLRVGQKEAEPPLTVNRGWLIPS